MARRAELSRTLAAVALLLSCLAAVPAAAHFLLNLNVRIFHVEHLADGLKIYVRMPMPYLVADRIGPVGPYGLPEAAPFTTNRMEDGKPVHFVAPDQLRDNPTGLGRFAADGLKLITDGKPLAALVEEVRAYPIGTQPTFATLEEAKSSFTNGSAYPDGVDPAYVGDVVVDTVLFYVSDEPISGYTISSTLDPGLPGQEDTANLILDHGPGDTKVFRARGLLSEPVSISRSTWSAIATFVEEGVRHILFGWDHVLFVLCLALGATTLHSLVWRATGFTLGHSVTLIAGFFGYVPKGAWFIPTVEMGIALSIIYAAVIALFPVRSDQSSEKTMIAITGAIGLLHGLGFSFVLHEILQVDAPNIWQSLLAFNVGVEIGQLMIILAVWPLFHLIRRRGEIAWQVGRWSVAAPCIAIALFWTGQRALLVLATV